MWPRVFLPMVLFALSCWGAWDSLQDPAGTRLLGTLPALAPPLIVAWYAVLISGHNERGPARVAYRILPVAGALPIPLALANGIFLLAAWLVPTYYTAVTAAGGGHYYWLDNIAQELLTTTVGGVLFGVGAGLFVVAVVALPVAAFRAPDAAPQPRRRTTPRPGRISTTMDGVLLAGVFLSMTGVVIATATYGFDLFPTRWRWTWIAVESGQATGQAGWWLAGVGVLALGSAMIVAACVYVLCVVGRARRRAAHQ